MVSLKAIRLIWYGQQNIIEYILHRRVQYWTVVVVNNLCHMWYCDIVCNMWYCDIVIYSDSMWYCDIVCNMWYCDIMILCYCDIVISWYCDIVCNMWYCDIAIWDVFAGLSLPFIFSTQSCRIFSPPNWSHLGRARKSICPNIYLTCSGKKSQNFFESMYALTPQGRK